MVAKCIKVIQWARQSANGIITQVGTREAYRVASIRNHYQNHHANEPQPPHEQMHKRAEASLPLNWRSS